MANLKQGTRVTYDLRNGVSGEAEVVGIANNGVPFLGVSYILRDTSGCYPNEFYPYEVFTCFESFLKVVE